MQADQPPQDREVDVTHALLDTPSVKTLFIGDEVDIDRICFALQEERLFPDKHHKERIQRIRTDSSHFRGRVELLLVLRPNNRAD